MLQELWKGNAMWLGELLAYNMGGGRWVAFCQVLKITSLGFFIFMVISPRLLHTEPSFQSQLILYMFTISSCRHGTVYACEHMTLSDETWALWEERLCSIYTFLKSKAQDSIWYKAYSKMNGIMVIGMDDIIKQMEQTDKHNKEGSYQRPQLLEYPSPQASRDKQYMMC